MKKENKTHMVYARITKEQYQQLERDKEVMEFDNVSQVVRKIIRDYLK
jgi:hypothetical protein